MSDVKLLKGLAGIPFELFHFRALVVTMCVYEYSRVNSIHSVVLQTQQWNGIEARKKNGNAFAMDEC